MSYSPDSPEQQQDSPSRSTNWPPSAQSPTDAFDAILLFHGLFCFRYDEGDRVCEVGVHSKAPDHKFGVFVLEFDPEAATPRLIYPRSEQSGVPAGPIRLNIERPRNAGVGFFQSDSDFEHDWRRVPDFEGPFFYDTKLENKPGVLDPIITIEHGFFYTATATTSEFYRVAEGEEDDEAGYMDLGPIAFFVGANLSHEEGGHVSLGIGGEKPLRLPGAGEKKYLIYFSNGCAKDEEPCAHNPDSPHKEERNDFHHYYKTFKLPGRKKEYLLKLKPSREEAAAKSQPTPASFQSFFSLDMLGKLAPLSNDKAPCGASGFGQSGE